MGHEHNVHDSDAHFTINPTTRAIKNDTSKKTTLMQYDHNSERFTFECPRYIEGHDMSLCNKTEVHYLNIDNQGKEKNTGHYDVDDLHINTSDSQSVVCSWLISKNATQIEGKLHFLLKFKCVEDGVERYAWHTGICENIYVSKGINADDTFETEYVDIIEQWKESVLQGFNDDLDIWKGETKSELQVEIDKAIDVERKRIDNIVALKDGSTTGDAELMDIRVGADGVVYGSAGAAVRGQIRKLFGDIDDFYETKSKTIICDGKLSIQGKIINTSGVEVKGTDDVYCTDYINITGYEKLEYSTQLSNTGCAVAFYDKENLYLPELSIITDKPSAVKISGVLDLTNEEYINAYYVRMTTYRALDTFECKLSRKGNLESRIIALEDKEAVKSSKWNKTLNVLGDSISYVGSKTWWEIISESTGLKVNSYAKSGTTLAHSDERHDWATDSGNNPIIEGYNPNEPTTWETGYCFVERVDTMDTNADAVLVMGGTNDSMTPKGSWDSTEMDTFFGGLNVLIKRLHEAFPSKPIIFCTMIQNSNAYTTNVPNPMETLLNKSDRSTLSLQLRAEAIKLKCKQYGLPCIDLFNHSGINGVVNNSYLYDGLHPNENGIKRISSIIQSELDKLFTY